MKRVSFLINGLGIGGTERVLIETLKILSCVNIKIKILVYDEELNMLEKEILPSIDVKYILKRNEKEELITLKSNKKKSLINRCRYLILKKRLNNVIIKRLKNELMDSDIIIEYNSGVFLKYILKIKRKYQKLISWIHIDLADRKLKRIKRLVECDKIVVICDEMKERLLKVLPKIEKKIEVIYNPFDIENIKNAAIDIEKFSKFEKELIEKEYIIMVSRLDTEQKDFTTLLKAYKLYRNHSRKNVKLYLLGDGKDKIKIEKMIKELGLKENVCLLGNKLNPYPWIKNAKILVHSSNFEGLPTVLIEGLILEKIVVSSECKTGPREILMDGKYGLLFPVGDYLTLGSVLENLLSKNSKKCKEIEKIF